MKIAQEITDFYHAESRRILDALIRLLHGNFELAEEAMQDAFTAALAQELEIESESWTNLPDVCTYVVTDSYAL